MLTNLAYQLKEQIAQAQKDLDAAAVEAISLEETSQGIVEKRHTLEVRVYKFRF